ncbi:formamidopyrimidine-DNA glycosylase [Agromyces luteolus]|uniref:Fpg/Nei family DNA glycosylase n=1 Tax=Agromyces luteolus TaxID=88373 RepID=A0A7C9LIK5_9MICO|nr:DNA-formamidopyrimidine glycosylase family protein [Agromyces luteolus]MUN07974.1 Fpg/Nei family DNA glycosylase [Agromyces luteolus]GLK28013.1 formamidopyrimidine-DNA glycosylase [Agromyces luteolus]
MPESPEVQALVDELESTLRGRAVASVDVVEFRVTKTRSRPLTTLVGERVLGVTRHGKLLAIDFDGSELLVVSLGRHGWARWGAGETDAAADAAAASADAPADTEPPPPTLVSLEFDGDAVLELTDAGGWVSLGCWVVDEANEVAAIAKHGPDPADPAFTRAEFDRAVAGRRKQLKAILQEQESLAGIGNAYSDEILFAARLSPVAHAATLADDELARLFEATTSTIRDAIEARRGIPIDRLKAAKVAAMRVHGRAGEPCPGDCGGEIRDFSFASTTAQYCPECQTGGELLPLKEG